MTTTRKSADTPPAGDNHPPIKRHRKTFRIMQGVLLHAILITACCTTSQSLIAQQENPGRGQWTEKEAWEWHSKVGIIKGFNAPVAPFPGVTMDDMLRKAAALGFNSFRIWMPTDPDECIRVMHELLETAEKHGLTISPVLRVDHFFHMDDKAAAEHHIRTYLEKVITEFRNHPGITFWDLVNEPALFYFLENEEPAERALEFLEWSKKSILWAREFSPAQPITISALFLPEHIYHDNEVIHKFREVASMTDIHNFHLYDLSHDRMKYIDDMVMLLKSIRDLPIVCTEAVARTRGGTFARSLTAFAKYHIHFYSWGLYVSDTNWHVAWELSAFEPYEPWFHDILHPDGTPYDYRDLAWIRNFSFTEEGEQSDPGAEITERWVKWRAWKWVATGPVTGTNVHHELNADNAAALINEAEKAGYNALRIKLDYARWKKDSGSFYAAIDVLLENAGARNMRIMPVLLSDNDMMYSEKDLTDYVSNVIKRFGYNPVVYSWELYNRPCESGIEKAKVADRLKVIFRVARFAFPNQPLTATPAVEVMEFEPGFDYIRPLVHGGQRAGWNRFEYRGSGDAELCNLIWSLSDIISVDSEMKMPETGWLFSVANRYGRPVICTNWMPPAQSDVAETLTLFSKYQSSWFSGKPVGDAALIKSFRFTQIGTPFR